VCSGVVVNGDEEFVKVEDVACWCLVASPALDFVVVEAAVLGVGIGVVGKEGVEICCEAASVWSV
jgi:hypothetical protein